MRNICSRAARRYAALGRLDARFGAAGVAGLVTLAMVLAGASASAATAATGRTASTLSLSDSGHLHLTSHHGFTLNEQGSASGTISGTIYIHLDVVSTNRVTAEVSIYPSGGSITGEATASYHPSGGVATFSGTMSVVQGHRPLQRRPWQRPGVHRHRSARERRRHGARRRPDVHLSATAG